MLNRDYKGRFLKGHNTNIGRIQDKESIEKRISVLRGRKYTYRHKNSKSLNSILKQRDTLKRLYEDGKIEPWNKGKVGLQKSTRKDKSFEEIYGNEKSNELKKMISLSSLGRKSNKGKKNLFKHSEEYKNKLRERLKLEHELGLRRNIYEKIKLQYKNGKISKLKGKSPWNKGTKGLLKANSGTFKKGDLKIIERNKIMRMTQVLPVKDTSIELKIQNYLKELNITFFTHQYIKEIEHGYQCDILIPSINLVIECDGDYWHKYPVGNDIDHIRTSELLQKGFKVLRLWENEIKVMDLNKFKNMLEEIK